MSVDLEGRQDILALADDLGEAIADLPEHEALEAAERAVKESDEAQANIERFERSREEFVLARRVGEATAEDVESIREIQSELHALPVMQEYLEAQAALEQRLARINEAISRDLVVDFADTAGSCCHD